MDGDPGSLDCETRNCDGTSKRPELHAPNQAGLRHRIRWHANATVADFIRQTILRPTTEIAAEVTEALAVAFGNTSAIAANRIRGTFEPTPAAVVGVDEEVGAFVATMIGVFTANEVTFAFDANAYPLISGTRDPHALQIASAAMEDICCGIDASGSA